MNYSSRVQFDTINHSKGPMDFYGFPMDSIVDSYGFLPFSQPAAVDSRCDRILWRRAADVEAGTNPLRSGAATFHRTVVRIPSGYLTWYRWPIEIDDFPMNTSIYKGFSMAMLNNQMVYNNNWMYLVTYTNALRVVNNVNTNVVEL